MMLLKNITFQSIAHFTVIKALKNFKPQSQSLTESIELDC